MTRYEKQKKEIETIKARTFNIELSEADVKRLFVKAGEVGLTPEELIKYFIGDLVDGTYSNGSDERMYAENWFDRCWFSIDPENSLIRFMLWEDYSISDFIDLCNEKEYFETHPDEENEDIENILTDYNEVIHDYIEWLGNSSDKYDIETEIKKMRIWFEQYKKISKNTNI